MIKDLMKETETHMKGVIEGTRKELASIRTGRANPSVLDKVTVEYYGTPTPLSQVANISTPEPRMLVVQPWDKSLLSPVEKAIQKADLGLNPINDGNVIRLPIPTLTEERRKDLVKVIKKEGEEKKVVVRNLRRDLNDKIKALRKDGKVTEDEEKKGLEEAQKLTDKYTSEIDKLSEHKEKEIMEI